MGVSENCGGAGANDGRGQTRNAMGCLDKSQRAQNWAAIMCADERLVTRVLAAPAVRFGVRRPGPPFSPMDFSARDRSDLLFGVFLARLSGPRIDWTEGNSPGQRILAGGGGAVRPRGLLVCADAAVVFEQFARDHGNLLGGHDRLGASGLEFLAARHARGLFCLLSLVRPRWGEERRPSRASLFLLIWECFRIYFESGVAKIMGGDPEWRNFTALDEYYQNGPLPTWIGWHMQHLPHWFHAATAFGTLALELGLAWMMFLPRRLRIICFLIVTPWQTGIILSANYTFLNYLVLALGFLLLDDQFVLPWLPRFWKKSYL